MKVTSWMPRVADVPRISRALGRVAVPLVLVDALPAGTSSAMIITWLATTFQGAPSASASLNHAFCSAPSSVRRAPRRRARGEELVVARLVVAVVALVEQEQLRVRAERDRAVDPVGVAGRADARHVLEERLVAVRAALEERHARARRRLAGLSPA